MGKLPAFLFYPKDWRNDTALLMCSRESRSVWIDMLCLMFFAPMRGVCATGDEPWSDQQIAAAIGGDINTNMGCISELVSKGVALRDKRGAIFSRRMVRDEAERKATADRVVKHRRNGFVTPVVTVDETVKKRACTGTANETATEDEIGIDEATSKVFLELQLAGTEARMLVQDAVNAYVNRHKVSFEIAADGLIEIYREYEAKPMQFKKGVFKFFKEGLWGPAQVKEWRYGTNREPGKQSRARAVANTNFSSAAAVGWIAAEDRTVEIEGTDTGGTGIVGGQARRISAGRS